MNIKVQAVDKALRTSFRAKALWRAANVGLPVIFGILASVVSVYPPSTGSGKMEWVVAFIIIATAAAVVGYLAALSSDNDHQRLVAQISGGDGFCFVSAFVNPAVGQGPFKTLMNHRGEWPLHDVAISIFKN